MFYWTSCCWLETSLPGLGWLWRGKTKSHQVKPQGPQMATSWPIPSSRCTGFHISITESNGFPSSSLCPWFSALLLYFSPLKTTAWLAMFLDALAWHLWEWHPTGVPSFLSNLVRASSTPHWSAWLVIISTKRVWKNSWRGSWGWMFSWPIVEHSCQLFIQILLQCFMCWACMRS